MRTTRCLASVLAAAAILGAGSRAYGDGMSWQNDIREALEEAEGRGVPLLVYLSRDD
jgi:hypothetical protein